MFELPPILEKLAVACFYTGALTIAAGIAWLLVVVGWLAFTLVRG